MVLTLTFNIPNGLPDTTIKEIRHIIMDSLYEFVSHRGPTAEDYVNKRYPDNPSYSWLDRKEKIAQVNHRILIASTLHQALDDIVIT